MASKRFYWHPVGYLIEKFMAPYLDTCADIHRQNIIKGIIKKVYTQLKNYYKDVQKHNYINLKKDLPTVKKFISEYLNIFGDYKEQYNINETDINNDHYDELDIFSLLDKYEKHIFDSPNICFTSEEKCFFNRRFEPIKKLKEEYNKKNINKHRKDILISLSPANLWYFFNSGYVYKYNKNLINKITSLLSSNEESSKQQKEAAYTIANDLGINNFDEDLLDLLQTAYYLRMMIMIASESYKANDGSKEIIKKVMT